jgi:hypothetical protein
LILWAFFAGEVYAGDKLSATLWARRREDRFWNLGAGSFVFNIEAATVDRDWRSNQRKRIFERFLICASAVALILGAAPTGSLIARARAQVAVAISAGVAPPPLPVYAQPPIPGPGYLFPGYWAWDGQEYYWVPGYCAMPPVADLLWTPAPNSRGRNRKPRRSRPSKARRRDC